MSTVFWHIEPQQHVETRNCFHGPECSGSGPDCYPEYPEQPEPDADGCICFWTDPKYWLSAASLGYGSGYEPGSQREHNPDCPVHPLESHMSDEVQPADLAMGPEGALVPGPPLLVGIQPEWAMALPIQMQSVLLLSTRGADGVAKHHLSKGLIRMYRACVIKAAAARRMLTPGDDVHDTFMDARSLRSPEAFQQAVNEYFSVVDELPFHYHLHLVHAAEILGYKYPDEKVRALWMGFYLRAVDDMHLVPESEVMLDARLNDFGEFQWIPKPVLYESHAQAAAEANVGDLVLTAEDGTSTIVPSSEMPKEPGEPGQIYTNTGSGWKWQDPPSKPIEVDEQLTAMKERIVAAGTRRQQPTLDPNVLCAQKQGGSNSPCIKPKGHTAPHDDGNYVW